MTSNEVTRDWLKTFIPDNIKIQHDYLDPIDTTGTSWDQTRRSTFSVWDILTNNADVKARLLGRIDYMLQLLQYENPILVLHYQENGEITIGLANICQPQRRLSEKRAELATRKTTVSQKL